MGIDDMKKGRISFRRACLLRIKLKLPIELAKTFSVSEIMGIARVLIPKIAIKAIYDEPPARPTEVYTKATTKNSSDNMYGDIMMPSIIILIYWGKFILKAN